MATFIDGIGASENIDTSGERVSMAGMDISSLTVDGVFNWEHKKDEPSQVVGKVLKAKKIFSDKDCEDDRQLYFWQKIQTPYLYVMGELFDDYKDSAKEVAGMFRYDADRKGQNERPVMNFSVEGGKIEKVGMDVLKSVARKITITVLPCNKAAIAEMVPNPSIKQPKDDIESIFKTEPGIEIELFKPASAENFAEMVKAQKGVHQQYNVGSAADGPGTSLAGQLTRENQPGDKANAIHEHKAKLGELKAMPKPSLPKSEVGVDSMKKAGDTNPKGTKIGRTAGGHDVWSHGRVADYPNMSSSGHKQASQFHGTAAEKAGNDPQLRNHHLGKMKLHMQAAGTAEKREKRGAAVGPIRSPVKPTTQNKFVDIPGKGRGINKSEQPDGGVSHYEKDKSQRGVHKEDTQAGEKGHQPGVSSMGRAVRSQQTSWAKIDAKNKLHQLKTMPLPSLPKSEDLNKAKMFEANGERIPARELQQPNLRSDLKSAKKWSANSPTKEQAGTSIGQGESVREGNMDSAKDAAGRALRFERKLPKPNLPKGELSMSKALTAGSGMGAPSTLEGGAALAKESLEGKRRKASSKSPWFARAEQEYLNWSKREQFETFMAKRMPHLSKGEIQAIGKVVALNKAIEMEQGLASMMKMARVDEGKSPEQKVKARGDRHLRTAWDEKPANQKVGEHKWEGKPDKKAVGHKEGFVKLQETGVHHPYDLDHPKGVGQSAAGMNTADHKDFGDHEAKASAKKIHHKVLGEMKATPKPNLPKK